FHQSPQRVGKFGAGGVKNCQAIQAARSRRWGRSAFALPGVQADVVVISAGGEECGAVAVALGDVEPEDVAIEADRAFEVSNPQMNVPDARLRMDRLGHKKMIGRTIANPCQTCAKAAVGKSPKRILRAALNCM